MSHDRLYALAECYDIAFDFRDVPAECDFLTAIARRHAGRVPGSFLELAAGPARHARELARRGLTAVALDSSRHMVTYARDRARADGVKVASVCGDMVDFVLERELALEEDFTPKTDFAPKGDFAPKDDSTPVGGFTLGSGVDLAALLMNSATYLLDNDAVLAHLTCVARHLAPAGVYVVEMSHPRDVFHVGASTRTEWTATRDGTTVEVQWGSSGDPFDPITQVTETTVTLRYDGPRGSGRIVDHARERSFTANEWEALVAASGCFRVVERLGAMNAEVPFSNDDASWRMVSVLQKVNES